MEDKYISAKELVSTMLEEAEKLPDDLPKGEGLTIATAAQYIMGDIKRVPAANVQPVKHGKWKSEDLLPKLWRVCSCCGFTAARNYKKFNFCPNCGARMDGEQNDS